MVVSWVVLMVLKMVAMRAAWKEVMKVGPMVDTTVGSTACWTADETVDYLVASTGCPLVAQSASLKVAMRADLLVHESAAH